VKSLQNIHSKIYEVRGQRIMLDFDLATLYEAETRILNQAVKRNADLFPKDFMFSLTRKEWELMSSQFVMTSVKKRPKTSIPQAFTEHGVMMLANILRSQKARMTSISIVRAFIALKNFSLNYKELAEKITELESKYHRQFKDVYEALNYLLEKDKIENEQKKRKHIGY
jgi:hypothetical protein